MLIHAHAPVEARSWLRSNPNPSGFAANRFWTTERAVAFVERLYALGASEVLVDHPDVDSTGLPYADTLLVRCTEWSDAHFEINRFCEEESAGAVPPGDFRMDWHGDELELWWD